MYYPVGTVPCALYNIDHAKGVMVLSEYKIGLPYLYISLGALVALQLLKHLTCFHSNLPHKETVTDHTALCVNLFI